MVLLSMVVTLVTAAAKEERETAETGSASRVADSR
jgi:hypothetical protein